MKIVEIKIVQNDIGFQSFWVDRHGQVNAVGIYADEPLAVQAAIKTAHRHQPMWWRLGVWLNTPSFLKPLTNCTLTTIAMLAINLFVEQSALFIGVCVLSAGYSFYDDLRRARSNP